MLLSCKISNSVFSYLESSGEDTSLLLEQFSMPDEFLRDTSYWLQASEMESFLTIAHNLYKSRVNNEDLIQKFAHSVPECRSWGLLDSVLRMMPKPQEILSQPERFLSYFISPQPPVDNLLHSGSRIEFDLPISSDQYPLTTRYLKYAFEMLPVFVGKPAATGEWDGIHFAIQWEEESKSIFKEIDMGHQLSPELIRSVVASLEQTERDLNDLRARQDTPKSSAEIVHRDQLRQEIARLSDYMVRAQQLVTLLVAQAGVQNTWVKEMLRRVDWDHVVQQFPQTVDYCQNLLKEGAVVTSPTTAQLKLVDLIHWNSEVLGGSPSAGGVGASPPPAAPSRSSNRKVASNNAHFPQQQEMFRV